MYHNVGKGDRLVRLLLAVVLLAVAIYFFDSLHYLVAYVMVLVAILLFVTGFVCWCPVFSMFGYSSRRRGLDRIKMDDIQRAVKENPMPKAAPLKKVRATVAGSEKKTVTKKKTTKKKTSSAKKNTTKTTKKAPAKKAAPKKKTVTKKKTVVKKK